MRRRRAPFSPAQSEAVRGIRANWPARRVMVFDRRREWGCLEVKAGGHVYLVFEDGVVRTVETDDWSVHA